MIYERIYEEDCQGYREGNCYGTHSIRTVELLKMMTDMIDHKLLMNGAESVRFIVVHCSATRADRDYTEEQLLRDHQARGFRTIGYHFYIRKSGEITKHRGLLEIGVHAKGYNRCSIGICYEGGLIAEGKMHNEKLKVKNNAMRLIPADTRTPEQKRSLLDLLQILHKLFPHALICGHRDLPGVHKSCPCFDATVEYGRQFE